MYQYLLFDLDGTLTDPKEGICKSVQYALAEAGIVENNLDVLEPFIGPPLKDSFMEFYHMTEEQAEQAIEKYRERFAETGIFENKIYPGIMELLKKLQEEGKYLAVASSKPTVYVERILEHFEIKTYFDVIVGSELDGARSRKEEVVEETLKRLLHGNKRNYDKCVMIGDRRFDIEGAREFGLHSIGAAYGYGGREELAKAGVSAVVDSVEELKDLLLQDDIVKRPVQTSVQESDQVQAPCRPSSKPPQSKKPATRIPSFYKVCQILYPLAAYWFLRNIVLTGGAVVVQMYFNGKGMQMDQLPREQVAVISVCLNSVAVACMIPFLWWFFQKDRKLLKGEGKESAWKQSLQPQKILVLVLTVIMGASLAVGLNIAIAHIDFSELSQKYEEVASMQYAVSLLGGLLIYGVIMPVAEELLFRGLIFKRIEKYFNSIIAIVMSAFIFGMYHGNLLQFIYGFLLGLAIAWCYKRIDSILVPIVFHSAANISVFVITYNRSVESATNNMITCVILLLIAGLTWWQYQKIELNSQK